MLRGGQDDLRKKLQRDELLGEKRLQGDRVGQS